MRRAGIDTELPDVLAQSRLTAKGNPRQPLAGVSFHAADASQDSIATGGLNQ
jgi:hypothetical protein